MKNCPKCGVDLNGSINFCQQCGLKLNLPLEKELTSGYEMNKKSIKISSKQELLEYVFGNNKKEVLEKAKRNEFLNDYINPRRLRRSIDLSYFCADMVTEAVERINKSVESYMFSFEDGKNSKLLNEILEYQKISLENETPLLYFAAPVFWYKIYKRGTLVTTENIYINGKRKLNINNITNVFENKIEYLTGFRSFSNYEVEFDSTNKEMRRWGLDYCLYTIVLLIQAYHYLGMNQKTFRIMMSYNQIYYEPYKDIQTIILN